MDVIVNDLGSSKKSIKINIPKEEIKEKFEEQLKEVKKIANIKGFRPGRVPRNILEKRFGENILHDIRNNFISEGLNNAIKEHELDLIGEPEFKEEAHIKIEEDFVCEFIVEIHPKFELPKFETLEVEKPETKITDADVEDALQHLRKQLGEVKPVEDGVTEENDFLSCNVNLEVEEKMVWGKENFFLEVKDTDILGLAISKDTLIGKKAGEKIEKVVSLPDDFKLEEQRGKEGKLTIDITEVKRITLRELTDEFAKMMGQESVEELKKMVEKQIQMQKETNANYVVERELLKQIVEKTELTLADDFLMPRVERSQEMMIKRMEAEGKSKEEIEEHTEKQKDKHKEDIHTQLKEYLIIEKVAKQEELEVTDNDLDHFIGMIAQQQQRWPGEIKKEYEEKGLLDELRHQIKTNKVLKLLREKATIKEKAE